MKKEDVLFLNENCSASRDDPDYNPLDLHIFWKNVDVSNQNEICIKLMISRGTTIEEIIAIDSIVDDTFLFLVSRISIILCVTDNILSNSNLIMGLHCNLHSS